jgi:hypothetical protein
MKSIVFFLSIAMLLLTACGKYLDGKDVTNTKVVQLAVDEIKLIDPNISDPQDARTLYTIDYPIFDSSKLLLRLGILKTSTSMILEVQPVLMRISIKQNAHKLPLNELKLCPITTEWMMGATWYKPQRNSKIWNQPGSDYDTSNCLSILSKDSPIFDKDHPEEKDFCQDTDIVCYDVSPYINTFIRKRNKDFGIVLINVKNNPIIIHGDRTARGPEIMWRKLKYY